MNTGHMKCAIFISKQKPDWNSTTLHPRDSYKQVTLQQESKFHHWQPLDHSIHTTPNNLEKGLCTKRQYKYTKRIPTCHSQENLIAIQSCCHIIKETVQTQGKLLCPSAHVCLTTHT